jgi:hypothetical protein
VKTLNRQIVNWPPLQRFIDSPFTIHDSNDSLKRAPGLLLGQRGVGEYLQQNPIRAVLSEVIKKAASSREGGLHGLSPYSLNCYL